MGRRIGHYLTNIYWVPKIHSRYWRTKKILKMCVALSLDMFIIKGKRPQITAPVKPRRKFSDNPVKGKLISDKPFQEVSREEVMFNQACARSVH